MTERVLGIEEAAAFVGISESSLYRIAGRDDSPFRKRCGRWKTTESALLKWIETGEKPKATREFPMPRPRRGRRDTSFAADLRKLEGKAA